MNFDAVMQPIETARGLPNAAYICPEVYAQERQDIFFKSWSAAAFISDVPDAGDAFPVDFLGMPLLVLRGQDGAIKVFQNTCRHRGMILISEPGKLRGPIRCPYHSWSYDYDGHLIRTPYVGGIGEDEHEAICKAELSLHMIRFHVWQGVIFVNVSGDAPEFEVAHQDIIARWREFDQPYYGGGAVSYFSMTLDTNWKLAVENYCESYHLPWIHPELNDISPIDQHYPIAEENFAGQGSLNYRQLIGKDGDKFPDFGGLNDKWNTQSEYIAFFPNVLMGVHRDCALSMILLPQGPEQTLERVAMFYAEEDIDRPERADLLSENTRIWQGIFREDVGVVEGMQKGRHGIYFDGGKFSPVMDGPTHIFHKWAARKMVEAQNA